MSVLATLMNRRAYWGTLPTFEQTRRNPMARFHVHAPDDLIAQVAEICGQLAMTKSKFIVRGIQLAVDDARKRFGEAANEPQATVVPMLVAEPATEPPDVPWPHIRRGDSVWFELGPVCSTLGLEPENIKGEIDPDDDVLDYVGKQWIDRTGLDVARGLSRRDAAEFWALVDSLH